MPFLESVLDNIFNEVIPNPQHQVFILRTIYEAKWGIGIQNWYLRVLNECGVLGFIFVISYLFAFWKQLVKGMKSLNLTVVTFSICCFLSMLACFSSQGGEE